MELALIADSSEDQEELSVSPWQSVGDHGVAVAHSVNGLTAQLAHLLDTEECEALERAARWHDIGKAHPAFQACLKLDDQPTSASALSSTESPAQKLRSHEVRSSSKQIEQVDFSKDTVDTPRKPRQLNLFESDDSSPEQLSLLDFNDSSSGQLSLFDFNEITPKLMGSSKDNLFDDDLDDEFEDEDELNPDEVSDDDLSEPEPWAKAPPQAWRAMNQLYQISPQDQRRGFRHELASALAIFATLSRAAPHHEGLLGEHTELLELLELTQDESHKGLGHQREMSLTPLDKLYAVLVDVSPPFGVGSH